MRLSDLTDLTFDLLFGRLLRRALGATLLAVFVSIALYYASSAGMLALSDAYGALYAYIIMAALYALATLIVLTVLWATRARPIVTDKPEGALASPRNMQIAMLIEAAALGYSMARKGGTHLP